MTTDNRRTPREVAEEVARERSERLMAYATPRYHKSLVPSFRKQLADACEAAIIEDRKRYLELIREAAEVLQEIGPYDYERRGECKLCGSRRAHADKCQYRRLVNELEACVDAAARADAGEGKEAK